MICLRRSKSFFEMNFTNDTNQAVRSVLRSETKDEITGRRRNSNRYGRGCHLTMMFIVWVAVCVPSNIIGVIFYVKNQNLEDSRLVTKPVLDLDTLEGYKEMKDKHTANFSTELLEGVSYNERLMLR